VASPVGRLAIEPITAAVLGGFGAVHTGTRYLEHCSVRDASYEGRTATPVRRRRSIRKCTERPSSTRMRPTSHSGQPLLRPYLPPSSPPALIRVRLTRADSRPGRGMALVAPARSRGPGPSAHDLPELEGLQRSARMPLRPRMSRAGTRRKSKLLAPKSLARMGSLTGGRRVGRSVVRCGHRGRPCLNPSRRRAHPLLASSHRP